MPRTLPAVGAFEWFLDREALPGWSVSWRLGRTARGAIVVAALKIEPHVETLKEWFQPVPGSGISQRLLRQLQLSVSSRTARKAMKDGAWPAPELPERPSTNRGRPPVYSKAWYKRLSERYRAISRTGAVDVSRQLAAEFKMNRAAMRSALTRCRYRHGYLEPAVTWPVTR